MPYLLLVILGLMLLTSGRGYTQAMPADSLRFDEACFLYTHNSYNVRGQHRLPNQELTVTQQLDLGVRGLMLDVYARRDGAVVYHASSILGSRPLAEDLAAIKTWLDAHPRDILSIIFELHAPLETLVAAVTEAELLPYLHTQTTGTPWPTLAEMVQAGGRLVLFSERNDSLAPPWLHHAWRWITENKYSNHSLEDFDTRFNRGDSLCSLYLMNRFITHKRFGTGQPKGAILANDRDAILDHALALLATKGRVPNFVALDFVQGPQDLAAVQVINAQFREGRWLDEVAEVRAERDELVIVWRRTGSCSRLQLRLVESGQLISVLKNQNHAAGESRWRPFLAYPPGDYWLEYFTEAGVGRMRFTIPED